MAFEVNMDTTVHDLKRVFTLKSFGIEAPDSWVSAMRSTYE
jgi:hypothetical protein